MHEISLFQSERLKAAVGSAVGSIEADSFLSPGESIKLSIVSRIRQVPIDQQAIDSLEGLRLDLIGALNEIVDDLKERRLCIFLEGRPDRFADDDLDGARCDARLGAVGRVFGREEDDLDQCISELRKTIDIEKKVHRKRAEYFKKENALLLERRNDLARKYETERAALEEKKSSLTKELASTSDEIRYLEDRDADEQERQALFSRRRAVQGEKLEALRRELLRLKASMLVQRAVRKFLQKLREAKKKKKKKKKAK